MKNKEWRLLVLAGVLLAGFGYDAYAGVADLAKPQAPSTQKSAPEEPSKPVDILGRTTPRGTVEGFFEAAKNNDYQQASHYLDLRSFPADVRESRGIELAKQLKLVLDRELDVQPNKISNLPEGDALDGLHPSTELLGKVRINGEPYSIVLRRIQSGESLLWFFSDTTVWDIPKMYKLVDYGFIQRFVPRPVLETDFLRVRVASWIGWILAVVGAIFSASVFLRILRVILKLFRANALLEYLRFSHGPFFLLLMSVCSRQLMKAFLFFSYEREIYNAATLLIFALTWLLVRTIDYFSSQWAVRVKSSGHFANTFVVPSINRAIKIVVIMIGLTIWLSNIGVNITAILTGLGIGGFAVNTDRLLAGVLVQNPMSVGGDPSRPRTNQMILQPFVVCQLGRGWFVRTQPPLYFDWERNNRIYPINFGVGSTFKIGPQLINWYVQPYWNITTGKSPAPQNGLTVGITFLYPHFWDRVSSLWKKDRPVPDAR